MDFEKVVDLSPVLPKMEWSQAAVLALVKIWKSKECLYNPKHELYHNKHARAAALDTIATNLKQIVPNISPNDVKTKINYLRSQYGRELLKIRESQRSGAGTDEVYIPSAYWFEYLDFLKDYVSVRKGKSNISYTTDDNSISEIDDLPQCSKRKVCDESSQSDLEEPSTSKRSKPKSMSTVSDADDILQVAKNYIIKLTEPEETEKPEQEFENSLLNFIRTNIREITDKNLQDEVVSKIMLLIFEYKKKQREISE